jgi:hypothetical protein
MATQLPKEEMVTIEELVVSHSYEMLALITVLEKKGILTREEIIEAIKRLRNKSDKYHEETP